MRNKRPVKFLIISLLLIVSLVYLLVAYSPTFQFSISNFQFPVLPLVIGIIFFSFYFLFSFILKNKRRGFLIASFVLGYLILKLLNLTFPFFIVLLAVLLLLVELLFIKRK